LLSEDDSGLKKVYFVITVCTEVHHSVLVALDISGKGVEFSGHLI